MDAPETAKSDEKASIKEEAKAGEDLTKQVIKDAKTAAKVEKLEAKLKKEEIKKDAQTDQPVFSFTGLTRSLPDNVNILTLEPWGTNKVCATRGDK